MGKKPKILVVGSFVMDQIVTTRVFPRQGQTILAERFNKAPGGKGANQAVQMARLGAQVTMCGKLGHDANGDEMRRTCEEAGIDTSCILYDDSAASGCSVIILEEQPNGGTENRILVVPGANMTITPEDVAFLKDRIAEFDLVVLQLEIPMEINTIVAKYAHDKGVPVMLNPAPSAPLPEELLACLTYLSPNEHEARDLSGVAIGHEAATLTRPPSAPPPQSSAKRAWRSCSSPSARPVRPSWRTAGSCSVRPSPASRPSIRLPRATRSSARSAWRSAAACPPRTPCALPTTRRP